MLPLDSGPDMQTETQGLTSDGEMAQPVGSIASALPLVIAHAPIGMMLVDHSGQVQDVNPRLCAMTGYIRSELLQMRSVDLVHPDDQAMQQAWAARPFEDGEEPVPFELRYIGKDERVVWVRITRHAVASRGAEAQQGIFFIENITSEWEVREHLRNGDVALLHSEAKFAAAFRAGPIVLTITRLATGQFIDVNDSFVELTGYTREEVLGRTPVEVGVWVEPTRRDEGLQQVRRGQPIRGVETDFRMKNGQIRTCLLAADLIEVEGELCVLTALTDITARKQAANILERYHLLSQYTRDIVVFIRLDGQIVEANAAAVRAYGYDRETLLSKHLYDLRELSTVSLIDNQLAQANRDGILFETVHRRKDGSTFPVEVSAVGADIGNERLVLSIIRDITDRVAAEAERSNLLDQLKQERTLLEEVLRQLPVGAVIAEAPSGRLILGNAQGDAIWRHPFYAASDIESYGTYRGFHADGRPYQPEEWPIARALTLGELVQRERITIERGDATFGVIEVNATPIRDPNGTIRAGVVVFQDVTVQERASEALHFLVEASALLTSSLDQDAILQSAARLAVPILADWCVIDMLQPDGSIATMAIAHADPEKNALGWDLVRRYPLDPNAPGGTANVIRTGEPELVPEAPDEMLDAIAQDADHARLLRQLGFRSSLCVALRVDKRVVGTIALVSNQVGHFVPEDIETIEEFARRIALALDNARLYAEAQQAISARDHFLSIASHELRTPLTSLMGYVALLQRPRNTQGGLTERDLRALRVIDGQTKRLNTLINSLLDISRLQMGQLSIEAVPFDLRDLARQVVEEAEPALDRHTMTLSMPDEPVGINGDMMRLEQVVQNLVQNAVKYSPQGGPVEVSVWRDETGAYLAVRDEGIGIPETALPELFSRFYRATNVEEARISGMGLGLFVVREIMALHGGTVHVESTEGRGSRFTISFARIEL